MNEYSLVDILTEVQEIELAAFDKAPYSEHKFSRKHTLTMKRIFKLYEKNTARLREGRQQTFISVPEIRFRPRTILVLVIMVFLAALLGCTAAYFISENFKGSVHKKYTEIFPINMESCPTTIETKYCLSKIPDGFELVEAETMSRTFFYEKYENKVTRQAILFEQVVKSTYQTTLNTEHYDLEKIEVNDYNGVCIDHSSRGEQLCVVIWDNGDYIMEVSANLDKKEVINLAKSTEKSEG